MPQIMRLLDSDMFQPTAAKMELLMGRSAQQLGAWGL